VRTIIAHGPRRAARLADDGRRIVAWQPGRLEVIDAGSGAIRGAIDVAPAIRDLAVVATTAYWVDARGALWKLDLAGTVPLQIAAPEPLVELAPSPDGRWLALVGRDHLLLLDRADPAAPPLELLFGQVRDLDWADDGSHVAVLIELGERTERQVVDVQIESPRDSAGGLPRGIDDAPRIVHRIRVGFREHLAFSRGGAGAQPRIYAVGPLGVGVAVAVFFALGERSTRFLAALKAWMSAHNATVTALIFLVIALKLLFDVASAQAASKTRTTEIHRKTG
jgi:hypothetical protein